MRCSHHDVNGCGKYPENMPFVGAQKISELIELLLADLSCLSERGERGVGEMAVVFEAKRKVKTRGMQRVTVLVYLDYLSAPPRDKSEQSLGFKAITQFQFQRLSASAIKARSGYCGRRHGQG